MFCTVCGVENPVTAKFCNACGERLYTPSDKAADCGPTPAATSPKICPACGLLNQNSASDCDCGFSFDKRKVRESSPPTTDAENAQGQLKGVGGWLLLFCIGTTIITPIIAFGTAASSRNPVVWFFELGLAGLAITTGVSLWAVRKNALRLVKVYFIVLLCVAALAFLGSFSATTDPSHLDSISPAVRTLSAVVIWGLYFKKSKRVKETFGQNL